jgi:hypothetical protein
MFLEIQKDTTERTTIIFNNISWLHLVDIEKYLKFYNIIIITEDFQDVLVDFETNNIDNILVTKNSDNDFIEIKDLDITADYISNKLNEIFDKGSLIKFLTKKSFFSPEKNQKIAEIIKKI